MSSKPPNKAAIDAPRSNVFMVEPEKLTIVTDPEHPLYDKRVDLPLDENMVLNIMAFGVKEAVIATKDGDRSVIVNGRQRVKHAIEANKRLRKQGKETLRVKVLYERGQDKDLFGITCFTNEFRRDDGIIGKAEKASRLLSMGKTEQEVCVTFGVTKPTLGTWLRLLEAAPAVRKAVDAGEVSASAASVIAKLPREDQIAKLTELKHQAPTKGTRAGKVSARKAKASLRKKPAAPERPDLATLKRVQAYLRDKDYGTAVLELIGWVVGDLPLADMGITEEQLAAFEQGAAKATA